MQLTSKVQTPITFLFVNKNIKFVLEHEEHFGAKKSDLSIFFDFAFSAPVRQCV